MVLIPTFSSGGVVQDSCTPPRQFTNAVGDGRNPYAAVSRRGGRAPVEDPQVVESRPWSGLEEASTASSTPATDEREVRLMPFHLVQMGRTVRRHHFGDEVPRQSVQVGLAFFAPPDTDARRAFSDIVPNRNDVMNAWQAQMALRRTTLTQAIGVARRLDEGYDSLLEARDAKRVSKGECGLMKFARMVANGQLSQRDQTGFWNALACKAKHDVVRTFERWRDVARHNMTEHQRRTVAHSLDRRKKLFDAATHSDVVSFINYLRGGDWNKQVRVLARRRGRPDDGECGEMVAQFWSCPKRVTVEHQFSLASNVLPQAGGAGCVLLQPFILRVTALLTSVALTETMPQRIAVFVQFLTSFDSVATLIPSSLLGPTQVTQRPMDEMIAQFGENGFVTRFCDQHKETIFASLCAVVAGLFKVESAEGTFRNFTRIKRITSVAAICSSVTTIARFVHNVVDYVTDHVNAWQRGMAVEEYKLYTIHPDLPKWVTDVLALDAANAYVEARRQERVAKEIYRLHEIGSRYVEFMLRRAPTTDKVSSAQGSAFRTVWFIMEELKRSADMYYTSHEERDEPFVVYIFGEPGVGKSTYVNKLAEILAAPYKSDFKPVEDLYVRNPSQKHWDGYHRQTVTICDDMFQVMDRAKRELQAEELVRMKNSVAYPLPVAEVNDKGKINFTSQVVIITSNVDVPDDLPVANVKAVKRRRDVVIRMRLRKEFATSDGLPDKDAIRSAFNSPYSGEIHQFDLVHPITGENVKTGMDRVELEFHLQSTDFDRRRDLKTMREQQRPDSPTPQMAVGAFMEIIRDMESGESSSELEEGELEAAYTAFAEGVAPEMGLVPLKRVRSDKKPYEFIDDALWQRWITFRNKCIVLSRPLAAWGKEIEARRSVAAQALAGLGVLAACLGGYSLYRSLTHHKEEAESCVSGDPKTVHIKRHDYVVKKIEESEPKAEGHVSGDPKTVVVKRQDYQVKKISHLEAQGSIDARTTDLAYHRFAAMLCVVTIKRGDGSSAGTNGILIGGKLILVPNHLILANSYGHSIEIITLNLTFECTIDQIAVDDSLADFDAAIIRMPNHFPSYPKQTHHFVNESDVCKYHMGRMALLTLKHHSENAQNLVVMQHIYNIEKKGRVQYALEPDSEYLTILSALKYKCSTQRGDCGSPLIWFNPSVARKIVGFHVAGNESGGMSNILTYEVMEKVFKRLTNVEYTVQCVIDKTPTVQDGVRPTENLLILGTIEDGKQFRQPSKSAIKPSLLAGVFPVTTKPAYLRPTNGMYPLESGVHKAARRVTFLPLDDFAVAYREIVNHYRCGETCMDFRVLTLEEGLNGVSGVKWIRPLNMKTSPGYPYILNKKRDRGKMSYVANIEDVWVARDELAQRVNERIALAGSGKIPETIFVDVLKDERREIEKVEQGKTRIFNTCPVDLTIAIRMYFGAFAAHIMNNHIDHECSVGINYHSEEWGLLYHRLSLNGDRWIGGDYSCYDKAFPRQLVMMMADMANEFYADGNDVIRRTLMETIATRVHLANKTLHLQLHGNPSGNPLTTIMNSLGNMVLMRLAYMRLARQHGKLRELYRFRKHVQLATYGDDVVGTVSSCIPWFNNISISKAMDELGMIFTPPKTQRGDHVEYMNEADVTYLKRAFRKEKSTIFAPLPKIVIYEITNWIRECPDEREAIATNVGMAKMEMFHWGEQEYNEYSEKIDKACAAIGIEAPIVPYAQYLYEFLGGSLGEEFVVLHKRDLLGSAPWDPSAACGIEATGKPRSGLTCETMIAQMKKTAKKSKANVIKPSQPRKQVVVKVTSQKQPSKPKQGKTCMLRGSEMLFRLSEAQRIIAIPLVPGLSGAPKLDTMANAYSWVEWTQSPRVEFRSLAPDSAEGIWLYRIVHDKKRSEVFFDPLLWDKNSRSYITQKTNSNFSITVPLSSMMNKKMSPTSSGRCSWLLLMFEGKTMDKGEFWLHYGMNAGGISEEVTLSHTYHVDKGKITVPQTGEEPPGIPVASTNNANDSTTYTFNPAATYDQVMDFIDRLGGPIQMLPLIFRRPGPQSAIINPNTPVSSITVGPHPAALTWSPVSIESTTTSPGTTPPSSNSGGSTRPPSEAGDGSVHGSADSARPTRPSDWPSGRPPRFPEDNHPHPTFPDDASCSSIVRSRKQRMAPRLVAPSKKGFRFPLGQKLAPLIKRDGSTEVDETLPFDKYTGYITVASGKSEERAVSRVGSTPALFMHDPHGICTKGTEEDPRMRLGGGVMDIIMNVGSLIATIVEAATGRVEHVVHKGMDALNVVQPPDDYYYNPHFVYEELPDISKPEEEEEFNPLPDVPDFDESVDSPGVVIPWKTTLRRLTGFVTDDNGKPIVKWLGMHNATSGATHISAVKPKYYSMVRFPWDKENKRTLGCGLEVDPELQGCFLLLQCWNWGEDSCGAWDKRISGIKYIGTCARFNGMAESRSVIQITDYDAFNSHAIQLTIGQSTERYFNNDEGRACMFQLQIGAVAEYGVALKFLEAYTEFPTAECSAMYWDKSESGSVGKPVHKDYTISGSVKSRTSTIPDSLEPFSPGFAENYAEWQAAPSALTRTLPIAITAGPIRFGIMGRVDEKNGWYQHIPSMYWSKTPLSGRWNATMLCGRYSTDAGYTKPDTTAQGRVNAMRITPPSALCSGALICVEIVSTGAAVGAVQAWPVPVGGTSNAPSNFVGGTHHFGMIMGGPLSVARYAFDAKEFDIRIVGDDSRPCPAIKGFSGDLYFTVFVTCYLLKSRAAANKWVCFDHEQSELTTSLIGHSMTTSSTYPMDGNFKFTSYFKIYKLARLGANDWTPTTTYYGSETISYSASPLKYSSMMLPGGYSASLLLPVTPPTHDLTEEEIELLVAARERKREMEEMALRGGSVCSALCN